MRSFEKQLTPSSKFNVWDTPWFNLKLILGCLIILSITLMGIIGQFFWDTELAFTGSSPLNLPPFGFEGIRGKLGLISHPLGTENSGRDMLALLIVGAPNTLIIGVVAAVIGMSVGILLGFTSGYLGGRVDDVIRLMSDVTITIPALMILVVINALLRQIDIITMALLIALFIWPSPTRLIRSQVLSMKQSGYIKMAKLSGASNFHIMFKEMLPNLIPYLFGSFIAGTTGAILAAVGLETLGLGPQRVPTLGGIIYDAINSAALFRNMWWWWLSPTVLLAAMFVGLLLINLGLDQVSNPRLRKSSK
jgi:peptide/nickel transport system permease protein